MSKDRTPSVGVVVVGDDLDVCAAVANVIRGAFAEHSVGTKTVPMDNLTSQPSFINYDDSTYVSDLSDDVANLWEKMCRARPSLLKMVIPIEVVRGEAIGSSTLITQDRGYIRTADHSLELEGLVQWTVPKYKKDPE